MTTLLRNVSGRLHIELSEPTERIAPALGNQRATPTAKLESLRLEAYVFDNDDFRDLTEAELSATVLEASHITLRGLGAAVGHAAPNGATFSLRELLQAIEATERETRGQSDWFDGIDVHHVFFEGLHLADDGAWQISWGS
ncbi:MAG: hypothetical protein KC731_19750 [Myxococcales bacterium]|nr:hypothetical protein [Myxococcales bacterium]